MTEQPVDPAVPVEPVLESPAAAPATVETVEAVVRRQMAASLGGRRGIVESAVPGIVFTVLWLTTRDLRLALVVSSATAVVALVARLVQRTTMKYVLNALFGIAIGFLFVRLAAHSGGSQSDQALAFFLPGIIYSAVYTVLMTVSCLTGWPLIGFMVGSVSGDPTAWHDDPQVVRLCVRLTWLFMAPGAIGVLLQGPTWFLGWTHTIDTDLAVALLGILRLGLGWPLRIAAWGAMVWLLTRDATPVERPVEVGHG